MRSFLKYCFILNIVFLSLTGKGYSQNNCSDAYQYCGNSIYLPLDTTGADMGPIDCLMYTTNPTWFFIEVDQPGDIHTQISGFSPSLTSGLDIDLVVSGPYSSLNCTQIIDSMTNGNQIVYCNYSTTSTNDFTLTNVQSGEIYVIVVTNFSNQEGYAQFENMGSTATVVQNNCITSVENTVFENLTYANPISNTLKISNIPFTRYKFSIYDLTGNLVFTSNYFSDEVSLNMQNFEDGCYIFEIITPELERYTNKFIKAGN